MMTETEKYQGWTNYETWNVNLWLSNDEPSYAYWQERAKDVFDSAEAGEVLTKSQDARYTLAAELKDHIADEERPELGGLYGDLLSAALSEVNWSEIANAWFEGIDGYEIKE